MNVKCFEIESKNRRGYPIKVLCKSTSPLSCEVSIVPVSQSYSGKWLTYSLIGIAITFLTGNACTYFITKGVGVIWMTTGLIACLIALWMKCSYLNPVKETIIVIKNIGIQVKTLYSSGRETSKFVDHKFVADIIINEAITMHQIIYYLAIVQITAAQDENNLKLIPLFMSLQPRLEALKLVYHFIRTVLFNETTDENLLTSMKNLQGGTIT